MSTAATVMMVVAILLVWGGLVAAIMNLRRGTPPTSEDVKGDL